MPPKPDRKRTTSTREGPASPPKRTRFASPPAAGSGLEAAEFEEQVASTLENPSAARRGRVNTAGYESDSTDDGEGVVESRKRRGAKGGDGDEDEDEDMFAMGEREGEEDGGEGKKKKKQEFLRLGDIEGQEFGDARESGGEEDGEDGEEEEDDDDDDEPEDEDDAERRKKAGMGYELSGFNMREEMEEGKFAADGTYVRTFDPHGVHDRWMDGVGERDIKKARRGKRLREREERARVRREEDSAVRREDAERELAGYLRKGETVLEALQRLGVALKKEKNRHPTAKKAANGSDTIDADADADAASQSSNVEKTVTRITDLASTLMSHGNTDIYSAPYEQLVRAVRASGEVSPDWVPPSQQVRYEYCWAAAAAEEDQAPQQQVYGPYGHEEMLAWHSAKYFGDDGEKVRVRTAGENGWHEWNELMF